MSIVLRVLRRVTRLLGAVVALAVLAALLIGVPWGLWHYIGWPLPTHIPSRDEIEATLLNPLSVTLLLNILACIAWPTWLVFAVDVARCVPDALRGVRPTATGPIHAAAGVLVAAVLLGLVAQRSPSPSAAPSITTPARAPATPVATQTIGPAPIKPVAFATAVDSQTPKAEAESSTVTIQPPRNGVYDSLSRAAQRSLGDGNRWPELFLANQGRVQADGRALTDPNLVYPGWVLVLPEHAPASGPPPASTPGPQTPAPTQPLPNDHRSPAPTPQQHPTPAPQHSSPVSTTTNTGVALITGGFVAASLASAVAATMLILRRRRRRAYRPGSGDREQSPPLAPAVHALRITYDQHQLGLDDEDDSDDAIVLTDTEADTDVPPAPEPSVPSEQRVEVGVRDERALAIDLAALHGLGITGAGAEATVRALLVYLLGTTTATVVMPEPDTLALLGAETPPSARLHITQDLDAAVNELSNRLRAAKTENDGVTTALVASVDGPHSRLQSLLDNGGSRGIIGILLGHWPAGGTVRVRGDGLVTASSPELDQQLRDARLFHVNATDTRDLIELFAAAAPTASTDPPPDEPDRADGDRSEQPARFHRRNDDSVHETEDHEVVDPDDIESPEPDETTPFPQDDQPIDIELPASWSTQHDTNPEPAAEREGEPAGDGHDVQQPLTLTMFGPLALRWSSSTGQQDLTGRLAPKHKALLAFLALHPDGTTREAVRAALWPNATGRRPFNAFYATLSQIRKIVADATEEQASNVIVQHGDQVELNPELVDVDYWHLHDAEHDRHTAATDDQRLDAWSRIAAVYTGELAEGMSALWLDGPREAAHRTIVDALAGMAAYYRGSDPQRQLQLLEHARLLNPENEDIYRDIMRAQAELGLTDAISRTLQLLTTALADIGDRPSPNTLTLARALQAREHRRATAS